MARYIGDDDEARLWGTWDGMRIGTRDAPESLYDAIRQVYEYRRERGQLSLPDHVLGMLAGRIAIESGGIREAHSPMGARGIMQLSPAALRDCRLDQSLHFHRIAQIDYALTLMEQNHRSLELVFSAHSGHLPEQKAEDLYGMLLLQAYHSAVERAATEALKMRAHTPCLGGRPLSDAMPEDAIKVCADQIGYVQHIDVEALSECAEDVGAEIWLACLPGSFVQPAEPLLGVSGAGPSDELTGRLRKALTVESARTLAQDPRFSLIVLSEIASRAPSPSVNDPGTAIDELGRLMRVLSHWHRPANREPVYPRLHVPPVRPAGMLEDAIQPIARDGVALVEVQVQVRVQKALAALARIVPDGFSDAASAMFAEALERACAALESDVDQAWVAALPASACGSSGIIPS